VRASGGRPRLRLGVAAKKVLDLLLCILHPIAVPFVPFVYVLTGNNFI